MTDLHALRVAYREAKEKHGPSGHSQRAFERLFRESVAAGTPIDSLDRFIENEADRFMAQIIRGLDGHVYWGGVSREFYRNDGKRRSPRRWWWVHEHGEITAHIVISPSCGEVACINPAHCEAAPRATSFKFTKEQMINAVKVAALRLGRSPTSAEWDKLGYRPSQNVFTLRFGSWENVIKQAGLVYEHRPGRAATPDMCVAAIRLVMDKLGRPPSQREFLACREELRAAHLPTTLYVIRDNLGGSWALALQKARRR